MTGADADARDEHRRRWDERHAARNPIEAVEPDPTLVEACGGMTPGRALDLGSGDGRNAVWLAQQGWRVTAVDFSSVAIERAAGRAATAGVVIDWRRQDLLEWHPSGETFDLVALVFIHLPADERRMVYASAAAAVTPGGTLLVVAHDRSNLEAGVGGPQDPEVLFTPTEIVADLPPGFVVDRAETVRRPHDGGRGPIDAVIQARRPAVSEG